MHPLPAGPEKDMNSDRDPWHNGTRAAGAGRRPGSRTAQGVTMNRRVSIALGLGLASLMALSAAATAGDATSSGLAEPGTPGAAASATPAAGSPSPAGTSLMSRAGVAALARPLSSFGFAEPSDVSALIAYRLPDWGYRTVDLGLDLYSSGGNYGVDDAQAQLSELAALSWLRESERRSWRFAVSHTGRWNWREADTPQGESRSHALDGGLDAQGERRHYLDERFSLLGQVTAGSTYRENSYRLNDQRLLSVGRQFAGSASLGLGWGRLRDVTPLLQARRISERLRALDRAPLGAAEERTLAEMLAARQGFNVVYDRPNRRFWQAALGPALAGSEPLTPFEVLYLADVERERLGTRTEGFRIDLTSRLRYFSDTGSRPRTTLGPQLALAWSHNPDLDHQYGVTLDGGFDWWDQDSGLREAGTVGLAGRYLWVAADRVHWDNRVYSQFEYAKRRWSYLNEIARSRYAGVESRCDFYVEDRLTLSPRLEVAYRHDEIDGDVDQGLIWLLELRLRYTLDNTLF